MDGDVGERFGGRVGATEGNFLYRLTPSVEKNGKISLDASHRSPIGSGAPRELFKQDQLGREVPIIAL